MFDKSTQRNVRMFIATCAMFNILAAYGADESVNHPLPNVSTLSQDLVNTQAIVLKAIATNESPEEALATQYSQLQSLCAAKVDQLDKDHKRYAAAEARTNVIGNIVTLIGSVTVYAPGKILLMGLGVSSSGSGTVSSALTQLFSTRSTADSTALAVLQGQLNQVFDRYDAIDPTTDGNGRRRSAILSRGTNTCLGLFPSTPAG